MDVNKEVNCEELYEDLLNEYKTTKDKKTLFKALCLQMDFIQKIDANIILNELLKIKSLKGMDDINRIIRILLLADSLDKKDIVKKIGYEAFYQKKYSIPPFEAIFAISISEENPALAEKHFLNSINYPDGDEHSVALNSCNLIEFYFNHQENKKIDDLLIKLIYRFKNREYYYLCSILYDYLLNNLSKLKEQLDLIKTEEIKKIAYQILCDKFYNKKDYKQIINLLKPIINFNEKNSFMERMLHILADCYIQERDFDNAINLLNELIMANENDIPAFYSLANIYIKNPEFDYNQGMEILESAYIKTQSPALLLEIIENYQSIKNIEKLSFYADNCQDGLVKCYIEGLMDEIKHDFDAAEKKISLCYEKNIIPKINYFSHMLSVAKNPLKIKKEILKDRQLNLYWPLYKSVGYLYGDFGLSIKPDKSLEEIKKASVDFIHSDLIIGVYYLFMKDARAFKVLNDIYLHHSKYDYFDVMPFLAYSYYYGIGVDKNHEEAAKIIDALLAITPNNVNSLLMYYLVHKDEDDIYYRLLEACPNDRYAYGFNVIMHQLALKNNDASNAKLFLVKATSAKKFASKREKKHYKKNKEEPILLLS